MLFDGESVLRKRGWRTDAIWTHPVVYKSFLKLIPLFFDTRALLKSQYWPREKIESLRDARLRELFRDARRVPYWQVLLEEARLEEDAPALENLSRIPISSKAELTQRGIEYISDASLVPRSDPDHTSGSTGKPFNFYQDWHASLRSFAVTERIFRTTEPAAWPVGTRPPVVYMRSRERNGFTFYRHVWFFLRAFTSIQYRKDDIVQLGRQLSRGFILYGYTSWVVELARRMEQWGITLPIRTVMVAGEHLSEQDRAYVERIMQTKLFTLYASRETGFLGYECERHAMHISEEWAYLEIVDATGQPVPAGHEGRIIVTTFDNRVMPFIRYDIGDIGVISAAPCACGRTLRTLVFKGRTSELIALEDNRVVSLLDIAYAMGNIKDAVRQYQIVQTGTMSFVIKIVPGVQFDAKKDDLEQLLVRMLHPRVQLDWDVVEHIPEAKSGKAAYFVRAFTR